jgi:predicted ATPase
MVLRGHCREPFAALLSLPLPEGRSPSLALAPQHQKQQTHDALAVWLAEETERRPVVVSWEDLHWADPSSLELPGLIIEQAPIVENVCQCHAGRRRDP